MRHLRFITPFILAACSTLCACASVQDGENEAVAQDSLVDSNHAAPPGANHRPPPEFFEACDGLSSGSDCAVELPAREVEGSCQPGPSGDGPLACAPANGPPPPPPNGRGPGPQAPPPGAVDACTDLAASDGCAFTLPALTFDGTCRGGPDGRVPLACLPSNMPPPHGGEPHQDGPPPEAVAACESLTATDACSVVLPARDVEGTCRSGPDGGGTLACAPADLPPPPPNGSGGPHGGPPPEAVAACRAQTAAASCQFTLPARDIDGTCRGGPDDGPLACVPAHMPPPAPPVGNGTP